MITVGNKVYIIYYVVHVLYNTYKFTELDRAETFVRYCVIGCTDIKDLDDVNIKIQYEEVEGNDRKAD